MREAVIVATARTPIGVAFRDSLNNIKSPTLAGHAIKHAVARSRIDPGEVEDVILGSVLTAGTSGINVARLASLAAGLPPGSAAQTIDRQCASGLMAIATAAKQIVEDGMAVVVAGGQENISAVQHKYFAWIAEDRDANVETLSPHAYMSMLQTAEYVAKKHGIGREAQDRFALDSQKRTANAKALGLFDSEIVPITAVRAIADRETKAVHYAEVTLSQDEGNRPATTYDGLAALKPVLDGGVVTAGNASQLSDGASASVLMERKDAEGRGLEILGAYRGLAVAGCAPEEMGVGPVLAVPRLLQRAGLRAGDIGLWELNEAFACQAIWRSIVARGLESIRRSSMSMAAPFPLATPTA
jgi:acetyl-CoA acetyltransferase family protein